MIAALRRLALRTLNAIRPYAREADLERELLSHVALVEDEHRMRGLSADEARLAARRAVGSSAYAKDLHRDARSLGYIDDVRRDVQYAVRSLRRSPGFALVAILTLALGIGANAAIFSVVHAVLLKPLPYMESDRLVRLVSNVPAAAAETAKPSRFTGSMTVAELLELRARANTLSQIGAYVPVITTMTDRDAEAARLEGWRVQPAVFQMLGVAPLLGRVFNAQDAARGADMVVILSYETWQRYFGGDRQIVGKTILLGEKGYSIIGVMPRAFEFPFELANRQFWTPLVLTVTGDAVRIRVPMLGQLAKGASTLAAEREVGAILRNLHDNGTTYELVRARDELAEPVRPALLMLVVAVGLVLLIACVNVANLLLARTATRQREIAIRAALGAGRSRLTRQLLTESLVLALLGAVGGIALAVGGIRILRSLATTLSRMDVGTLTSFPRLEEIGIDAPVLAFTIVAAIVTGALCGLVPAVDLSRVDEMDALREGPVSAFSSVGLIHRARTEGLVVAEIALAMMLLVGGGLLIHSFVRLVSVPLGYDPSHVLTFQVAMPAGHYKGAQIQTFAEDLVERLRQVPRVQTAAYAPLVPMVNLLEHTAGFRRTPEVPRTAPSPREDFRGVSYDYFKVMGIRVVAGRGFNENDRPGQPRVVVINRALARRDFAGENPIGQMVYLQGQTEPWQIVGIVDDVRQVVLDKEPTPQVFVESRQWPGMAPGLRFLQYYTVRSVGDPMSVVPHVRDLLRQLDPQAAVYHVALMEQLVSNSISRRRLYAVLVGVFAGVALGLAAIGIYGVMTYSVAQRTREIGIRMALGAQRVQVLALVLRDGLILTTVGIALGLVGAAITTRLVQGMLFGITPLDPTTFIAVSLMFGLVATVASYVPARRATNVDPVIALRCE
jgi:putative ABC transport system permease protein